MASEKMTALILSGPIGKLDEVVERFVVDRPFHPEDAVAFLSGIRHLRPVEADDPYTPALTKADGLLKQLGLTPAKRTPVGYDLAETLEFLQQLEERLAALEGDKLELDEAQHELDDPILRCLESVPESMKDLWQLHYVHGRLGRMPEAQWPELKALTDARDDEFSMELMRESGYVYVSALALESGTDRLDANLSRLGFERFRYLEQNIPDATAAQILDSARAQQQAALAHQQEHQAQKTALVTELGEELLSRRAYLAVQAASVKAKSYAGRSLGKFYLTGWIPAALAENFAAEFESIPGCSAVTAKPKEVQGITPPVRLKSGKVRSLLTPLMDMYGTPAYGTADPRIFMVMTYILFFGMMFGDAGQGLCLALLGFLLYKKTKAWLWRVIGVCGCSAVVFGLIYGSVFGLEDLLPWGGYHPLDSDHIMPVLLAGAAVGVVVLLVCMVFNIANSLQRRDIQSAFFSPNGLAGAVLYTAVIAAIVCAYTGVANLLVGWYILLFIVLPVLLIWFGEPLAKLVQGDKNWQPESWGMFVVEGFFDIFEAAISYMSNTMSFLRLGAFAISHAGMMMVVSMLSENMAATGSLIVMVIGNIFVAGLEAALSSIQIIRLEFYEIFGRFYVGGGKDFAPITVEYEK
jgi:V/A-type H+-transporting ATPase subunit I